MSIEQGHIKSCMDGSKTISFCSGVPIWAYEGGVKREIQYTTLRPHEICQLIVQNSHLEDTDQALVRTCPFVGLVMLERPILTQRKRIVT